jgi:hypothetical protein
MPRWAYENGSLQLLQPEKLQKAVRFINYPGLDHLLLIFCIFFPLVVIPSLLFKLKADDHCIVFGSLLGTPMSEKLGEHS